MPSVHFSFMSASLQFFPRAVFWNKGKQYNPRMANPLDSLRSQNSPGEFTINPGVYSCQFGILEGDRKYLLTDVFCPMKQILRDTFAEEES